MRTTAVLLAAVLLAAFAPPARAKPRGCLTSAEMQVEELVRHGVFLREASALCDSRTPGTRTLWAAFNKKYGPLLRAQTMRRAGFFRREFPKAPKQMTTYFDGRLVTHFRNVSTNKPFCSSVLTLLKKNQAGGWGSFIRQAKRIQDNVRLDFRWCGR